MRSGRPHRDIEYRAVWQGKGSRRQLVLLGATTRFFVGGKARLLLCFHDVTEHRRAEEELLESERRFRTIFEYSMAGILLTAPDGRIFAANPAACRLLGRSESEICRLGRKGLVDPDDPRLQPLLKERSEKGHASGELNLLHRSGRPIPVHISSAIFETRDGLRTWLVFLDLSQIKVAEKRIREFTQKLLAAREEERSKLSGLLHHEIGSLVVGVTARLDSVEAALQTRCYTEAQAELNKAREIFLQSTKHLREEALKLHPPALDLLGLHNSLLQHVKQVRENTGLRIRFVDATRPIKLTPKVQSFILRTVQECLNNVIKHAKAQRVWLRLTSRGKHLQLTVRDDGRGFNAQGLNDRRGKHMGLSVIQEMSRMLGGETVIDSSPGNGTRITVRLPLERKHHDH